MDNFGMAWKGRLIISLGKNSAIRVKLELINGACR